ncbi:MAG: SemiSWEET family sugar transporter [Spirochaetes bacterium]|nr:SemiSWEET family sugar transporter [Spirochaetota bacterium]MCK5268294.1 SemiSWEET family sugar transporter [Spirochaetota bacterium]
MKIGPVIGIVAALLTTISFIPQVVKTVKYRDTRGISLLMYMIFTIGVFLWMVYGIIIKQWPVILANAVTTMMAGIILFYKIKEPKQ